MILLIPYYHTFKYIFKFFLNLLDTGLLTLIYKKEYCWSVAAETSFWNCFFVDPGGVNSATTRSTSEFDDGKKNKSVICSLRVLGIEFSFCVNVILEMFECRP